MAAKSGVTTDSTERYQRTVREHLRTHDEVIPKELRAGVIHRSNPSTNIFYTSVNHNSEYVTNKHVIGHRSTHDGFWRPEMANGYAVFHHKQTTRETLKHLVFNRLSELTAAEANNLLDRRCYRALKTLADQQEIYAGVRQEITVYPTFRTLS